MEEIILKQVDNIADQMIKSIIEIVKINSVETAPLVNAPFGQGVKDALDASLALGASLGLAITNVDNYMGYASYGKSKDYICAIGHLDVVPARTGWKHPPFSGYQEDGVIYSRGILDNKGPIISCLYALYVLKELKIELSHEIRIIFGCDEETGFEDLKYYLHKEKPPLMGFTPDCKYPVVYGERGRAIIKIVGKNNELKEFFDFVNDYILNAKGNGERFNIDFKDEEFGLLEVRDYQLNLDSDPSIQFSVSYPANIEIDLIMNNIKTAVKNFEVTLVKNYDPVKFEKDCKLVKTLVYTYEKVTGNSGLPVTTTGGTYAKLMPNIVPFGPSFPGQKGIGHQPNEWMTIKDIITNAKIYALSLYYLAK